MMYRNVPHFVMKANLQKSKVTGVHFYDVITEEVLKDICRKITGLDNFTYEYVENAYKDEFLPTGYNKGGMAILQYKDSVSYISFSEKDIAGRNSSVQSVPTAFNMFFMNPHVNKKLYYYFLDGQGNASTDYQILMYRLMKTIGFHFLNADVAINQNIYAFSSMEDIMYSRRANTGRNQSNNSTYITKSGMNQFDIYGKTYGANKYETSMMCYALSALAQPCQNITLYEMLEGNLAELPQASLEVLSHMSNISVVPTDMQLEKRVFSNSLRSPRFIYNLLERLGPKHCAFCDCEIPELIQGAHIWSVADIKRSAALSLDEKIHHALNGENGLWLCENHHKLFDEGLLNINLNGEIVYKDKLEHTHIQFMDRITTNKQVPNRFLSNGFLKYLEMRNRLAA